MSKQQSHRVACRVPLGLAAACSCPVCAYCQGLHDTTGCPDPWAKRYPTTHTTHREGIFVFDDSQSGDQESGEGGT